MNNNALTADAFRLYYNFNDAFSLVQIQNTGASFPAAVVVFGPNAFFANLFTSPSDALPFVLAHPIGNLPFAVDPTPFDDVVTPIPPALPLFATGLGALGLLGWSRKRKAAALAA